MSNIKTSWSTEHLQMLTQVDNHKIMYDGYEYYWLRKLEDDWERHFILNFEDSKKAYISVNLFAPPQRLELWTL